jgi:hypothetical protein
MGRIGREIITTVVYRPAAINWNENDFCFRVIETQWCRSQTEHFETFLRSGLAENRLRFTTVRIVSLTVTWFRHLGRARTTTEQHAVTDYCALWSGGHETRSGRVPGTYSCARAGHDEKQIIPSIGGGGKEKENHTVAVRASSSTRAGP